MKEEEDKSHRGLETTVENTRGQICPVKTKWVQRETQMQWMWTKTGEKTELAICAESGTIWPKIVRRDGKRGE